MMLNSCPVCQVGKLKLRRSVFVRVYSGTLVHVPNVDTWTCDVCGHSFYDPTIIRQVEVLIGESGPPPNRHPQPRAAAPVEDADSDKSKTVISD
jgi:YgiT-type zinc finger domain-containing protein